MVLIMEHIDLEDGTVCLSMTKDEAKLLRQLHGALTVGHNRWANTSKEVWDCLKKHYEIEAESIMSKNIEWE